eukprot:m.96313 g.96313  ORF g.96313 m.96313 type:complete len:376 (+) comp26887_c0_seq2:199-1326(+)
MTVDEDKPDVGGPAVETTPVISFKKKGRKQNIRGRTATVAIDEEEEEDPKADSVRSVLAEAREEQTYRNRAKGLSALELAAGEKISMEHQLQVRKPWSLETGGIMPKKEEEETTSSKVTKGLGAFQGKTDIDWEDAEMKRYIEEQIRLKSEVEVEDTDTRTDYEKRRQNLYTVPQELRDKQKEGKLKDNVERGMLSSQMLSGIPEVDLGLEAKFESLEKTEKARLDMLQGKGRRQYNRQQTDNNLNYSRARFMIGGSGRAASWGRGGGRGGGRGDGPHSGRGGRGRGRGGNNSTTPGLVAGDGAMFNHEKSFEAAKKRAFDTGKTQTATYNNNPDYMDPDRPRQNNRDNKRQHQQQHGASDDHAFARFKKNSRRF